MLRATLRPIVSAWILVGLWIVVPTAGGPDLRLVEAAKQKDWEAVGILLEQDLDADAAQADGATALHWAAFWNDIDTVALLVEAGAKVNAQNDYGATPLWCACANRNTASVRRLLEAGADPNLGLRSGESVLMRCVHTGDASAVSALVGHGADVSFREPSRGQTSLMWAAANAHPEATRVLLEHGADVNARTTVIRQLHGVGMLSTTSPAGAEFFNAGGFTPLLFAARSGDVASARLLLEAGADLQETAADGNSALVVAAMSGHGRLAESLLEKGAVPDADGAGYTALHAAVLRSDPELAKALLAKGANPNARLVRGTPIPRYTFDYVFTHKEKGATPFLLTAKYLEPELMPMLNEAGADPLIALDDGTTVIDADRRRGGGRALDTGQPRPADRLDDGTTVIDADRRRGGGRALDTGQPRPALPSRRTSLDHFDRISYVRRPGAARHVLRDVSQRASPNRRPDP